MKRLLLSMLGVSLLLLGSCSQETPTGDNRIPGGKMKLKVELGKLTRSGGLTRAEVPSEEGEDRVSSLYLLFFAGSDNGSGAFRGYTEVAMPTPDPATNPNGDYSMSLEAVISYPAGVDSEGDYSILALANVGDNVYIDGSIADWMEQWEGQTENYVISHAKASIPSGSFSSSQLLMHGSERKPAGSNQVHMLLKRDVSRIDVTKESTFVGWEIATVSIWNSFPGAYIFDSGMMDYTENTERVRRHYQITPNTDDGNIKGGLYAFENQVGRPEDNDIVSTCLIIGLQPVGGGGPVEYFRVNMHDDTGAQHLRRNYVYNLSIEGKTGTGATSEEIAYLGESNKLIYTIDDWNQDVNGLTVQDDYSKLTIPTKTVIMGGSASVAEYKIFTFSTLQSPSPLQIRSQTYRPAVNDVADNDLPNKSPIWARLDGNTLIIESTDLEGLETERSGVIVLSYAGLEISMNVSQAGEHDNFLIVTEPDGGILPFAAYAGIPSGLIRVQASGHWTATLHMTGFSFDSSQATDAVKKIWTNPDPDGTAFDDGRGYNNTLGLIVPDEFDPSVDKFRVYTHSHNMGQAPREAIIVIELDGMEEQYSATIVLTQNYVKNLHYVHSAGDPNDAEERVTSGGTITFDGMGNVPTTGSYAGNNNWWYVFSGYEEGTTKILPWSAVMVIAGGADDRNHFQIVRNVEGEPEIPNATGYDVNDPGKNKVMIRAKGMNISGRDYRVTLRVQTDPGTFADIEVVQKPASFELTPGGLLSNKVPSSGGTSDKISLTVENGEGLKWKINSPSDITFSEFQTKAHDRRLVNYGKYPEASGRANDDITLVIVDASGNPTGEEFAYGKEFDVDKSFRVKFPKIYFPNRDIEVTASVTVTLNSAGATSGGIKQTVRVAQNALTRRPTSIYTTTTGGYGQIYPGESYSRQVRDAVAALGSINYSAGVVPEGATFLYRTNYGMNSGTPWTETNKFIDGDRGVFYLAGDYDGGNEIGGVSNAGSPLRSWGVTNADPYAALNTANDETKVWDFLFNRVGTPTVLDNTRIDMNYDGMAVTTIPASAVAIFTQTTNTARHHFVIDPKNRIIFCADAQLFDTQGPSAMKASILAHLMMYVDLAGGYGSGFSDMLIDSETEAGGGVPAPWDEWWGANAVENFERTYNRY